MKDIIGGLTFVVVVLITTALYLSATPRQMSGEYDRAAEIELINTK